jgi:hypothetical protein
MKRHRETSLTDLLEDLSLIKQISVRYISSYRSSLLNLRNAR